MFASRRGLDRGVTLVTSRSRLRSPAPRKTRRGPRTRRQILDAALKLFSERGFARTSVRDIAQEAGITDAAIYYHFSSKRDLFEALMDERGITAALRDLEEATLDPPELGLDSFTRIALGALEIMQRNRDFMKVLLSEAISGDPVASEDYRMVTGRWSRAQAQLLRRIVDRGELPPIDVDEVARALVIATIGPFIDDLMQTDGQAAIVPPAMVEERVQFAVERIVQGLRDSHSER